MRFEYIAQDELECLDKLTAGKSEKINDLVTINITIEMDKKKYEARKAKYKEPIPQKILKLFG